MNERDRRSSGKLYHPYKVKDENFMKAQKLCSKLSDFAMSEQEKHEIFEQLLGAIGPGSHIVPPFRCDLGRSITIGKDTFINMEFLALDEAAVTIGNRVFIGPRLSIYTPIHPYVPEIRITGLETCQPVTIEDDVWIGGSVVIGPGVTIGQGSIIGMGSVVTKSIPAHVIAAGNPCKVIRPVTDKDHETWNAMYQGYMEDGDICHE